MHTSFNDEALHSSVIIGSIQTPLRTYSTYSCDSSISPTKRDAFNLVMHADVARPSAKLHLSRLGVHTPTNILAFHLIELALPY